MSEIKKDWTTEAGLRAVILFVHNSHHCGYVAIPKEHPLFGVDYGTPSECLKNLAREAAGEETKISPVTLFTATLNADEELGFRCSPDVVLNVHGGITYAGGRGKYPVESENWWFGFDCAHFGDKSFGACSFDPESIFRDVDYCVKECESLAEQLARCAS